MKTFKFTSHSESETMDFAFNLANKLKTGDVIVLSGDLGSGKTKFTEGFLKYFNLSNQISSPTFTIVNEYKSESISIFHFDVYRLNNEDDFLDIGGDEYFGNGICIIEWGEIIKPLLPPNTIWINFQKDENDENIRIINIQKGE